jgi:hypothetical protein
VRSDHVQSNQVRSEQLRSEQLRSEHSVRAGGRQLPLSEVTPLRRRLSTFLVVAALAATFNVLQPASPAGATPWGRSWSGDYATEEWGDPWDFSNDADWDVQARLESPGAVNAGVGGGTLNFDVNQNAGGVLIGSAHYGENALQWGRSMWLKPIDGSTYPTLTFRLYVPPGTNAPAGGVSWFNCSGTVGSCMGSLSFHPQPGWNTYSFTPGWGGQKIYSLLIIPTAYTGAGFKLDWVRVTRAGGQTDMPAPGVEPVPVVMNPDRPGGADYATTVNGNPWDFNDGSDVAAYEHVDSVSYSGGALNACNTNNDPAIVLPLAAPFDGSQFHRLRINVRYDGGFSLADAPGGGMNARVMWTVAGVPGWQVSEDIVVYPGWNDMDLDMLTWPLSAVNEADLGPGAGWIGRTITGLRIDFHEDRGRRCFSLDDVKLQADDTASPSFPIAFRDDAAGSGVTVGGTTAEIFLDSALGTYSGTRIAAGVGVGNGVNTFTWSGAGVPAGTYWVRLKLTNPSGRSSEAYSSGPLRFTGKPPVAARTVTPVSSGAGGASAALVNLTMTDAPGTGYITAARCENLSSAGTPSTSNGNFQIQQSRANLSVVPVDANGSLCIWNESPVHLIADVQGRFDAGGDYSFVSVSPRRLLDTRQTGRAGDGSVTEVLTGTPAEAEAVLVNLTTTNSTAGAFITADRCSAFSGEPSTSNGNPIPGRNVANLSVVPVENGRFCIYSKAATDLVVDTQGYLQRPPGGHQLTILAAASRVLDTRRHLVMPGRDEIIQVDTGLPASSNAALVNLTMVDAPGAGYITAGWCATMTRGFQPFSNGNFVAGQAVANLSVVPIEGGKFCIYTENPTQLIVDVQGHFTPNGALRFTLQSPTRVLDTRSI